MTNRTAELITTIREPETVEEEALWIAGILTNLSKELTLQNAAEVLALGIENAPGVWLLTLETLPAVWVVAVAAIQKDKTQDC